jgi:hypothetical protein
MLSRLLFFICISLFFISCEPSEATVPPVDPQTETFANYLSYNFGDSIGSGHHLFILITKKDSRENVSSILNTLHQWATEKLAHSCTTIISSDMSVADSLLIKGSIKTDWDGTIDKMKLPLSGVTIVLTANKKIEKIFALTTENVKNEDELIDW